MTNPNPGTPLASNLFGPSRLTRPSTEKKKVLCKEFALETPGPSLQGCLVTRSVINYGKSVTMSVINYGKSVAMSVI